MHQSPRSKGYSGKRPQPQPGKGNCSRTGLHTMTTGFSFAWANPYRKITGTALIHNHPAVKLSAACQGMNQGTDGPGAQGQYQKSFYLGITMQAAAHGALLKSSCLLPNYHQLKFLSTFYPFCLGKMLKQKLISHT